MCVCVGGGGGRLDGYPKVILFDIGTQWHNLNNWKTDFYNTTKIGVYGWTSVTHTNSVSLSLSLGSMEIISKT